MAYRIHFTTQDLARTRVADASMPMFELQCAMRALQDRSRPARLDSWRRHAQARLTPDSRLALSLVPAIGFAPTFLTPAQVGSPEDLLEMVRRTPGDVIDKQLAAISELQPTPSWARELAGDAALHRRVSDGMRDLWSALLAPYWPQAGDLVRADRTVRTRQLLDGGVERLLTEANPRWMRWRPPVLEIRMPNGVEQDLFLHGQGVVLVPSMFHTRTLVDDESRPQPTVSYPAGLDQPLRRLTLLTPEPPRTGNAVSALLGGTRAAVLHAIAEHPGCSTKELAALTGIAPASASEHATVLRQAGLTRTSRHRNTALHSVTGLGIALLNGSGPAAPN